MSVLETFVSHIKQRMDRFAAMAVDQSTGKDWTTYQTMTLGGVLAPDERHGAGWAKPALVLAGRIYRCDGNMYRARNDADTDWLNAQPEAARAMVAPVEHESVAVKPPPLPRPERVEPWQVWELAHGSGPVLILECGADDITAAAGMRSTASLHRGHMLGVWEFRGWFKPRIGSRTWTGRAPLLSGVSLVTEANMRDPTNGDWLPEGNPTDADIAEWRETWGRA